MSTTPALLLLLTLSRIGSSDASLSRTNKSMPEVGSQRAAKFLSMFQIVQFPNAPCPGASVSNNGTCYSAEECNTKGGSSSGTCAEGFGVCCIFTLACGETSSENNTYLSQSTSSNIPNPCMYTICPTSSSICRIKLDFRTFDIAGPQVGTTVAVGVAAATDDAGIGDCMTDTFTVSSFGQVPAPLICGYNSGQHMILDASPPNCHKLNFGLHGSASRSWDIAVTQYDCADSVDIVGPPDCLQYLTGVIGTFATYNYPATYSTAATHLSNQEYSYCIRTEQGFCAICYSAADNAIAISSSFGLSISSAGPAAMSLTTCTSDYIHIPHGQATVITTNAVPTTRFCGRFLGADNALTAANTLSVCTSTKPFMVTLHTDDTELNTDIAINMANINEQQGMPGGILGFKLQYIQQAC